VGRLETLIVHGPVYGGHTTVVPADGEDIGRVHGRKITGYRFYRHGFPGNFHRVEEAAFYNGYTVCILQKAIDPRWMFVGNKPYKFHKDILSLSGRRLSSQRRTLFLERPSYFAASRALPGPWLFGLPR